MVKLIFDDADPTLVLADQKMESNAASEPKRTYLGVSAIGDCERRNYFRFHGVQSEPFKAPQLKNFRDGHNTEDLVIKNLREVEKLTIVDRDPDTGGQIEVSDFEGHFQGHLDFEVLGLEQAPKTWHVGEVKCSSQKKFEEFKRTKNKFGDKQALFNFNMIHYVQAQLYMHYRKRTRHWTVVASAGGRDWASCRTNYDAEQAEYYINRAERIINQPEILPDRVSESADWWQCRFCEFVDPCHNEKKVVRHCRTCVWGAAGPAKSWKCFKHDCSRSLVEQAVGCSEQLYRPTFVAGAQINIGENSIDYQTSRGKWTDRGPQYDD